MYIKEKLKILLWEYDFSHYMKSISEDLNDNCEIIAYLATDNELVNNSKDYPVISIDSIVTTSLQWNYIIVNDVHLSAELKRIFTMLNINADSVIYITDFMNYASILIYMLKRNSWFAHMINFHSAKMITPYFACVVNDIKYLQLSQDNSIMAHMYFEQENFSKKEIDLFIQLAEKYYGYANDINGIFLDVGGNIGTTSIYVKKNINSKIRVFAFEPSKDNYKMLKINLILNEIDENEFHVEKLGVSNQNTTNKLRINTNNMGNCSIANDKQLENESQEVEAIECVSLDYFIETNEIDCKEIKYLWVDTEGFEAFVLDGAINVIQNGNFPVFLEFTPGYLINNDSVDLLLSNLKKLFKSFICTDNYISGDQSLHSINEIDDLYQEYREGQTNLFLIK